MRFKFSLADVQAYIEVEAESEEEAEGKAAEVAGFLLAVPEMALVEIQDLGGIQFEFPDGINPVLEGRTP